MSTFKSRLPVVAAAALLIGSFACAPVHAADTMTTTTSTQSDNDAMTDNGADSTTSTTTTKKMKMSGMDNVEARIQSLHDKLKITPDQENDWKAVAQTMRDNETEIHQMVSERHDNTDMTAVEDLQSYQKITQAHAEGIQKMISSFQPLYNEMTDMQKKNADQVFGRFEGRAHDAKAMKSNG